MLSETLLLYFTCSVSLSVYSEGRSFLPVEESDFYTAVKSECTLVDKTEFIQDIMEDKAKVILITRPHHFGKTFGLSMLHNFLASNDSRPHNDSCLDLFQGLKISNMKFSSFHKYQYPVVHVSFEGVVEPTAGGAEAKVRSIIKALYRNHEYLLHRNKLGKLDAAYYRRILDGTAVYKEVKSSIASLSRFLHAATGKEVILLFDAYDRPFYTAYYYNYDRQMTDLIGEMLIFTLEVHKEHVKKAVLSGKLVLTNDTLLSKLADLKIHSAFHDTRYAKYFGFTEAEVDDLLRRTHKITQKMELAVAYYGYNFSGSVVYNPHSIIMGLAEGKPGSYWSEPELTWIMKELLMAVGMNVKGILVYLFQSNSAVGSIVPEQFSFPTLRSEESNLWTLLVHAGFLNAVKRRLDGEVLQELKIPTLEAKNCLVNLCKAAFKDKLDDITAGFIEFENNVKAADFHSMAKFVARSLRECGNFFNFKIHKSKEIYFSYFLGLVAPLLKSYTITTKRRVGYGQCDIALAPRRESCAECPGMIFELQIAKDKNSIDTVAVNAAHKVADKQYISEFQGKNYTKFYGVGVGLYEQQVSIHGFQLHRKYELSGNDGSEDLQN